MKRKRTEPYTRLTQPLVRDGGQLRQDAAALGVQEEELVRISSRRASIVAPIRIDTGLRAGLAFMSYHDPDLVDTNALTIEATCPIAGTAEYKAAAIRVEQLTPDERAAHQPAFDAGIVLSASAR